MRSTRTSVGVVLAPPEVFFTYGTGTTVPVEVLNAFDVGEFILGWARLGDGAVELGEQGEGCRIPFQPGDHGARPAVSPIVPRKRAGQEIL